MCRRTISVSYINMPTNNTTLHHKPTISVLVPVYKTERTIKRCLDSIQAQTFTDFEVIVIDDGTPDNAIKIAQKFVAQDSRFRIVSQSNKGLGAARNTGLMNAKGNYISCVDSDDTIEPTMFEKMIAAIISNNADMSICEVDNPVAINGNITHSLGTYRLSGKTSVITGVEALELQLNYIEPIIFNSVCFKLIKASLFKENHIRFPENHRFSEDTPTSVALFLHSKTVTLVREPLYNYIHEGESLTSSYSVNKAEDLLLNIKEISKMIIDSNKNIALDNFVLGLLFPLEKHLTLSGSKDLDRIQPIKSKAQKFRKIYTPKYKQPSGIPLVQKIKIFCGYHNLCVPLCKLFYHLRFIPFVKHML